MADARWPKRWVPRSLVHSADLDHGCQVNVYVRPLGGNQVALIRESFKG